METRKAKQISLVALASCLCVFAFQNCTPYSVSDAALAQTASSSTGGDVTATPIPDPLASDPNSTNRSLFFGQSRCATSGLDFCDDFENGTIGSSWEIVGTQPTVDAVTSARGSKALHITKTGSGSSGLRLRSIFPAANDTFYGRMFVRFASLPAAPLTYLHWTMMGASGTGNNAEIRIGGEWQSGKNRLHIGTDGGPTGDWGNKDSGSLFREPPLNEWMCVEWMYKGDTSDTKFWWDGVEHPTMATSLNSHGGNKVPFELPIFNRVWIGWTSYQSSTETFELFVDEVAFHHERIGCVR